MTLYDLDLRHSQKEQRKRGRRTNIESLKNIGATLDKLDPSRDSSLNTPFQINHEANIMESQRKSGQ